MHFFAIFVNGLFITLHSMLALATYKA